LYRTKRDKQLDFYVDEDAQLDHMMLLTVSRWAICHILLSADAMRFRAHVR